MPRGQPIRCDPLPLRRSIQTLTGPGPCPRFGPDDTEDPGRGREDRTGPIRISPGLGTIAVNRQIITEEAPDLICDYDRPVELRSLC
jgi:hypothetical protein